MQASLDMLNIVSALAIPHDRVYTDYVFALID